ncbi:unnamed protein product [Tuber aestivum]|uniref:Postreplication repair E3 ubiquitin-protein ligase RAD18 n=1 Tax=Tuber aestivum TaxID=59557 RepID=A0A292Q2M9_9PEZI|nr:unnamed protein product [Tuber aestivum]
MSQPYLSAHSQRIIDVTDPSDWNTTRLPLLGSVDSALRCQICKDYYHTPVMTGCCHTFCSECIRRSLVREQKCPVCRATAQENQLRKNGAAQELVAAFVAARPLLMEVAKESVEERRFSTRGEEGGTEDGGEDDGYPGFREEGGRKRRRGRRRIEGGGAPDGPMESAGGGRITRGSSGRVGSQPSSQPSSQNQVICLDDDDGDEDYKPPPSSGMVACPICSQYMKEKRVDSHIESGCPKESPASPRKRLRGGESSFFGSSKSQSGYTPAFPPASKRVDTKPGAPYPNPANPLDLHPLPKIAFNMMKESALRSKLQELGIPSYGSKRTLQDRYNEWLTLWNANVDSVTPKSKKELLKQLSSWDAINRVPVVEKTKVAGWTDQGWSESNKSHYDELIAKARTPRVKPEPVKEGGEEEEEAEAEETDDITSISSAQMDGACAAPTTLPNSNIIQTTVLNDKVPLNNVTQSFQPDFHQPYLDQAFTTALHSTPSPPPPFQAPPTYLPYSHVNVSEMFVANPLPPTTVLAGAESDTDRLAIVEEDSSLIGLYGKRKYEEMEIGCKKGGGSTSGGL